MSTWQLWITVLQGKVFESWHRLVSGTQTTMSYIFGLCSYCIIWGAYTTSKQNRIWLFETMWVLEQSSEYNIMTYMDLVTVNYKMKEAIPQLVNLLPCSVFYLAVKTWYIPWLCDFNNLTTLFATKCTIWRAISQLSPSWLAWQPN